jgi:metal-responsive CopG/Arc/MetJ family transcriptional regulator
MMEVTISLDKKMANRLLKLTGYKKIEQLIEDALNEFIRKKDYQRLLELRGKIHWEGNLDELRRSRV